jgi:ribonuclease-3
MEKILGQKIEFSDKKILKQALTHRSASKKNNERLEFLGDSILSFVITKWLYHHYQDLSEGKLTRIRANLVKGVTLAEIGRHYHISDSMTLGIGELKSGGFNRSSVIADMVEAVFGAVFIDKGIDVAEKFILAVMKNWLENVNPNISDKDAKTRLQEHLQKNGFQIPDYSLIQKTGKDHLQVFKMKCTVPELGLTEMAENRSRKKAEQQAAQNILMRIKEK